MHIKMDEYPEEYDFLRLLILLTPSQVKSVLLLFQRHQERLLREVITDVLNGKINVSKEQKNSLREYASTLQFLTKRRPAGALAKKSHGITSILRILYEG